VKGEGNRELLGPTSELGGLLYMDKTKNSGFPRMAQLLSIFFIKVVSALSISRDSLMMWFE